MRNIKYAPNSVAVGVVGNAQRRAKRAAIRERQGRGGIPAWVNVTIGIVSVLIVLVAL